MQIFVFCREVKDISQTNKSLLPNKKPDEMIYVVQFQVRVAIHFWKLTVEYLL